MSRSIYDTVALLQHELAVATGAYAHRRHDADHRALRKAYIEAKLRFRRWWRMAEAQQGPTPPTLAPCPRCSYEHPRIVCERGGAGEHAVQCPACRAQSWFFPSVAHVCTLWNARAAGQEITP